MVPTDRGQSAGDGRTEAGLGIADGLRSVATVGRDLLAGRLRHRRDRLGTVIETATGQRFVVYRETARGPPEGVAPPGSAVLAFQFHLRFVPRPIRPLAVRVFEPLSVLTTPFFAGLPGFRTKLWCFDHGTGDYLGVYQWATVGDAERYARSLRRLMDRLSVPGSVTYEVVEDARLDDFLESRNGGARDGP